MTDLDDLPRAALDPLKTLAKEDLEPFSVEALELRIAALESEIARCRQAISEKGATRGAAEALFKKT